MATLSPSRNPARPITPLEPKTPESMSSNRKSNSFHTSKASNPSDSPHRSSASKIGAAPQSLRSSFELKENERDLNVSKQARARSPAVAAASKGAKNFMAPTISASSKIIAASPRRKILGERNEIVRSSLTSVSDPLESPVMEDVVPKSEVGLASRAPSSSPKAASMVSSEGAVMEEIGSKPELSFCYQDNPAGTGSESRKSSLEAKHHHSTVDHSFSSPLAIAPLDADPSLPPYDPKTNYLSPRPQFLHYRPNPRIEQYLTGEGDMLEIGDGKRLEDSFSLESCQDSPGHITEEGPTSSPDKDSEEESLCSELEASSPQTLSQPNPHGSRTNSRFSLRFIFASFSLVLLTVLLCIPLLDSPTISSSSILKSPVLHSFPKLYIGSFSLPNLNLKELANRMEHWSIKSFADYYTSEFSTQREEYGPFHVANLTASLVEQAVEIKSYTDIMPDQEYTSRNSEVEQENVKEDSAAGYKMEDGSEMEARGGAEIVEVEQEEAKIQMEVEMEEVKEDESELELKKIDVEVQEEVNDRDGFLVEDKNDNDGSKGIGEEESFIHNEEVMEAPNEHMEISHEYVSEPEKIEQQEDVGASNSVSETLPDGFEGDHIDAREEDPTFPGLKSEGLINNALEGKTLTQVAAGVASLAIALAATLVFLYKKQKQTCAITNEQMPAKKHISKSVSGSSESYLHPSEFHYQNSPIHMEMMGDSGPSALSSSLNNSSSSGHQRSRKVKEEDTLSHERRLRRESAVSSSTSYGSFTTYEKISAKKGNREEEAMTPVRRSSRIRNLVTSP